MEIEKQFVDLIDNDIKRIEAETSSGTNESRWELFRDLDGKYQVCISDFYKGMRELSSSGTRLYLARLEKDPNAVTENLKLIKSKLLTFKFQANAKQQPISPATQVNISNNINLEITFEQVRSQIDDMTSLTDEETADILDRVNVLEEIINSTDKKKTKWEKAKPILVWLANKSFDVGMKLLPLLLKLGD